MIQKIIPYGKQEITENDIEAVINVLKSDFLTQGPCVQIFENKFAKYIGAKYAVAVSNATAALHLATLALKINKNDRVLTTPITFVASANCLRYSEAEVDFVDIDPETYLMDLEKLKLKLLSYPIGTFKGIVAVDFAGRSINYEELKKIADTYNLWIIEDACHAPGGFFIDSNGVKQNCGNGVFADLSIFSFHPVKHIATGEGGMITTNNEELYFKILELRTHGITKDADKFINNIDVSMSLFGDKNYPGWYMEMQSLGYNYRLTDMQAALGISQLDRASQGLSNRIMIAKKYNDYFTKKDYIKSHSGFISGHAYHLYIIQTEKRNELYEYLKARDIYTQVHYIPCHLMPYYQNLGWKIGDLVKAEDYYKYCLTLPIFPGLTNTEIEYILESVNNFFIEK